MGILTIGFLIAGLALLVGGAEMLVRGATRLSLVMGISPLVIGLTVVAFGSSSPEVAVSVQAAAVDETELILGLIIGSNIANVLLVLGIAALVAPLLVRSQLVRIDVPIMIGASVLVFLFALDGEISRIESGVLFLGAIVYCAGAVYLGTRRRGDAPPPVDTEGIEVEVTRARFRGIPQSIALIVIGLGLLILGSDWLVDSATEIALSLGVSQMIIGLTVVAIGTSSPEIVTTVIAAYKGERDLAVGTVVGSNIANIFFVLGLAGVIAPSGIPVPASALNFDLLVMIAVAVACLPIFFTGGEIARWEGALFVLYFVAYITYLVLQSQQHEALPAFSFVMLGFVLPITAFTLIVLVLRTFHRNRVNGNTT